MSVSGHKSVESLAIYQWVHEDKKMMMGLCLTYSLLHPQQAKTPEIPATIQPQLQLPAPQPTKAIALK